MPFLFGKQKQKEAALTRDGITEKAGLEVPTIARVGKVVPAAV